MLLNPYLDEGAWQEEAVCQTDFHTAKQRCNACAVSWQVAEEVDDLGVGGDWGLQHTHKWVAVDGLNGAGLRHQNNHHQKTRLRPR